MNDHTSFIAGDVVLVTLSHFVFIHAAVFAHPGHFAGHIV
jgi:hypothetical protein